MRAERGQWMSATRHLLIPVQTICDACLERYLELYREVLNSLGVGR